MRNTSAGREISESNSPTEIMHGTPKEDKYASLDQDILELDRMLEGLKETRKIIRERKEKILVS